MYDVKSRGWRKLMKRDTKVTQQYSQLLCAGGNMVKETARQEEFLLIIHFEHYKASLLTRVTFRL